MEGGEGRQNGSHTPPARALTASGIRTYLSAQTIDSAATLVLIKDAE